MKHFLVLFLLTVHCSIVLSTPLADEDVKWLNRITYGINSQTVDTYQAQGRKHYLDIQLSSQTDEKLPAYINEILAKLLIEQKPAELIAEDFRQGSQRIQKLPPQQKQIAHDAQSKAVNQLIEEAKQRHLLRALYSSAQIKEQMTWFWLNHFNVFRGKGPVHWLAPDYEESAIRPHVLGKFRDLLMATLRHPAMLIYLDNSHNAVGKINENYARELMELHTLGIDGGYSQQDVQALSRILTGVGVNWTDKRPKIKKNFESYYLRDGNFEFNPNRHDFSEKQFLGKKIIGNGFAEIEKVVDILANHPSTARFISHKLAVYFVSDTPSPNLIENMAKTFQSSGGDIPATLHTLFESKEFIASLGKKVSDPMHYILAAVRFAYDGQQLSDVSQIAQWFNVLNEPLYGHLTPDGYGMTEKDWISPSQLIRRFEIAKRIINSNLSLSSQDTDLKHQKFSKKPIYQVIEPILSNQTKAALDKAISPEEWNTFLLSAPEFIYR